jgi:hypothetical protein
VVGAGKRLASLLGSASDEQALRRKFGIQLSRGVGTAALLSGILFGPQVSGRAETLTVATYNIENYGVADRMTDEGYRKEYPKPEAEKQALRAVIRRLKADVLLLQEVGGPAYLEELRRDLKAEGLDYPQAYVLEGNDPDRHVAVLSRRPFKAVVPHPDLEFPYFKTKERVKRGLLELTLFTAGGEVTLFAVHLKSRFTDRPDDPQSAQRRVGEATAIRDAVLERFPDPAREDRRGAVAAGGGRARRELDACVSEGGNILAGGPHPGFAGPEGGGGGRRGPDLRPAGSEGGE